MMFEGSSGKYPAATLFLSLKLIFQQNNPRIQQIKPRVQQIRHRVSIHFALLNVLWQIFCTIKCFNTFNMIS